MERDEAFEAPMNEIVIQGCLSKEIRKFAMHKRAAFTLVEMLVSMALILFIMVILSSAFSTGLQVFRQLKGLGDMEERLRSTSQILRRDLAAYHFENTRKLSDTNFWTMGPPQQGFFRIWQGSPSTSGYENQDGDSLPSYRATNHILHFTSRLSGQGQGDFATSSLPSQLIGQSLITTGADNRYQQSAQFRGRWYEVVYFMRPTGLAAGGSGAPVYTLYRRQLGVIDVPGGTSSLASQLGQSVQIGLSGNPNNDWAGFSEISCKKSQDITNLNNPVPTLYPDTVRFSSPADLTMPARRFAMLPAASNIGVAQPLAEVAGLPANPLVLASSPLGQNIAISGRTYPILGEVPASITSPWGLPPALPAPYFANPPPWQDSGSLQGADLMLGSVISFQVQVLTQGATDFSDLGSGNNSVFQKAGIGVFDTWSSQSDGTYDYSNSMSTTLQASGVTVPLQLNILALKITIRVWDEKTLQARQITIIQDM